MWTKEYLGLNFKPIVPSDVNTGRELITQNAKS